MQFFNHYSAPILAVLVWVAGTVIIWRRGKKLRDWIILDILLIGLAVGWILLRPVATTAKPAPGLPVLLEVQSPYCLGCVAIKPAVDRVETEFRGRLTVRRVDIQSTEGRVLVARHQITLTPTFIFFDRAGQEQWRSVGQLDAGRIRSALGAPL